MRLGQLARKLSLRPSQIIEFLAQQNIQLEDNSNTRIDDQHVETVVRYFAPASLEQIIAEPDEIEEVKEMADATPVEEPLSTENVPVDDVPNISEPEIIRVQKIELSGLKVLGKIELPEPKKKESPQEAQEGSDAPQEKSPANDKRRPKQVKDRRQQRPWKNPVEQQREREARAAEEKRRAETEREKERRKRHYEKKRKVQVKPKQLKVVTEKVVFKKADTRPVPKTWFGKFLRWWTT